MAIPEHLVAAIREDPYDSHPFKELAEYLSERGDPRGELILTQQRDGKDKRLRPAAEILAAHPELVPTAPFVGEPTWENGFIMQATLGPGDFDFAGFLAHESCTFLGILTLRGDVRIPDDANLSSLRCLTVADPISSHLARAIAARRWPELYQMSVRVDREEGPACPDADLEAMFNAELPFLALLELHSVSDRSVRVFLASRLPAQIEELQLHGSHPFTHKGTSDLVAAEARFANLRDLRLTLEGLSPTEERELYGTYQSRLKIRKN